MALKYVVISCFVILLKFGESSGHGRLVEPVHRGGAWRKGYDTPINYDDNSNFCGGFSVQHYKNKGKCGPCGDNYSNPQPRNNENGGKYGTGTIVQHYHPGQEIELQVEVTANHQGHFEFSLCPLNSTMDLETDECFDANPIFLADGTRHYQLGPGILGVISIQAVLPTELTCQHCVLRWHYHCGNNWGVCSDGSGRIGCGIQETFRTCSDVSIQ